MQLQDSPAQAPERHCFLIFLVGIAAIALTVPLVCWSVDALFHLLR